MRLLAKRFAMVRAAWTALRSDKRGVMRFVFVLTLCELAIYLIVSASSQPVLAPPTASVHGARLTLTPIPAPALAPSRALSILGASASAFANMYGAPISSATMRDGVIVLSYRDEGGVNQLTVVVAPPAQTVIMVTLQAEDSDPWSIQTAETICRQFAPGDATPTALASDVRVSGGVSFMLYSRFLAGDIQANLPSVSATQHAGDFSLTLAQLAPGAYSGCTLALISGH